MEDKIDFVLPWVDGSDIKWRAIKSKFENKSLSSLDENSNARYRDMDTLKYVLRSIEKNCPWYNKIHLITCGQVPVWLDIKHPKINLVTHEELYIKKNHLPVFSSSSIEMNLSNLKGVSEKIVYLNDDTIIINQVNSERFFSNNKPVDFFNHALIPRNKIFEILKGTDSWVNSLNNCIELINTRFKVNDLPSRFLFHESYKIKNKFSNLLLKVLWKKYFWIEHWHHPQPYLMSSIKKVYNELKEPMLACSSNKFRSNNDLTQYLCRYWHLAAGEFEPRYHEDGEINNITSKEILLKMFKRIDADKDVKFVCFNDSTHLSDADFEEIKSKLSEYLETKFSTKSFFEI